MVNNDDGIIGSDYVMYLSALNMQSFCYLGPISF